MRHFHSGLCLARDAYRPSVALRGLFADPSRGVIRRAGRRHFALTARLTQSSDNDDKSTKPDYSRANDRHAGDIYPDDLAATLEAHRESNAASVIRKQLHPREEDEEAAQVVIQQQKPTPVKQDKPRKNVKESKNLKKQKNVKESKDVKESESPGQKKKAYKGKNGKQDKVVKKPVTMEPEFTFLQLLAMGRKQGDSMAKLPASVKRRVLAGKKIKGMGYLTAPIEYDGQIVLPYIPSTIPDRQLPWLAGLDLAKMPPHERLTAEIRAFNDYLQPSETEKLARDYVTHEFEAIAKSLIPPSYEIELFGSSRTGLSQATSDVDVRVFKRVWESDAKQAPRFSIRKHMSQFLENLVVQFRSVGPYTLVNMRHARYPLITMQHRGSGIDIQFVSSNDTALSREYMARYMQEYPGLREVFAVLKTLHEVRGLQDVFRGGMGSYALFMMVAGCFRITPDIQRMDLGQKLVHFFRFWSEFDYYKQGLSLEPPEFYPKGSKKVMTKSAQEKMDAVHAAQRALGLTVSQQPYLLSLQDPADPLNDLGRKTYAIKHFQETYRAILSDLETDLRINRPGSFLQPLVAGAFESQSTYRRRLEEFGDRVRREDLMTQLDSQIEKMREESRQRWERIREAAERFGEVRRQALEQELAEEQEQEQEQDGLTNSDAGQNSEADSGRETASAEDGEASTREELVAQEEQQSVTEEEVQEVQEAQEAQEVQPAQAATDRNSTV